MFALCDLSGSPLLVATKQYGLLLTAVESQLASVRVTSFISLRLCGRLWRQDAYKLDQARRNTGDSESSTKELTRGLVRTASIRSKIAFFPLPNSVYAD